MEKKKYDGLPDMTWTPPRPVPTDAERIQRLENYIQYLAHEVDRVVGEIKEIKK